MIRWEGGERHTSGEGDIVKTWPGTYTEMRTEIKVRLTANINEV